MELMANILRPVNQQLAGHELTSSNSQAIGLECVVRDEIVCLLAGSNCDGESSDGGHVRRRDSPDGDASGMEDNRPNPEQSAAGNAFPSDLSVTPS